MIICSNCGTTNNEQSGRICRKCGALLPIANKPPRIKISQKKAEKQQIKEQRAPPAKKKQSTPPKKPQTKKVPVEKPTEISESQGYSGEY